MHENMGQHWSPRNPVESTFAWCKQTIDCAQRWLRFGSLSRAICSLIAKIVKCAMNLIAFKVPKIVHKSQWIRRASEMETEPEMDQTQQVSPMHTNTHTHSSLSSCMLQLISNDCINSECCLTSETLNVKKKCENKKLSLNGWRQIACFPLCATSSHWIPRVIAE